MKILHVPEFKSYEEEAAFWDNLDSSEYMKDDGEWFHFETGDVFASDVRFMGDEIHVALTDGQEVSAPLEWFPRLRDASGAQRAHWRLIGRGIGIHWEDVDEDISVTSLLRT